MFEINGFENIFYNSDFGVFVHEKRVQHLKTNNLISNNLVELKKIFLSREGYVRSMLTWISISKII